MSDNREVPVREAADEYAEPFGRRAAVAIVVITLAGAIVAFLQAQALKSHNDAAVRAQQYALLSSAVATRDADLAHLQLSRVALAQQDQAEAASIEGAAKRQRWEGIARTTARDTRALQPGFAAEFSTIGTSDRQLFPGVADAVARPGAKTCGATPSSAAQAPSMPRSVTNVTARDLYLNDSQNAAVELDGERDAYNQQAEGAEEHFTRYAVTLAGFSVAVVLLGFSLTPRGRDRRQLFALATAGLALSSAGWAVWTGLQGDSKGGGAAAAVAVAEGTDALQRMDASEAVRLLNCAIRTRPSFARAYELRADAYELEGTPIKSAPFVVLETVRARRRALRDYKTALHLRSQDALLFNNVGYEQLALGVTTGNAGAVRDALDNLQKARRNLSGDPLPAFNYAAALVAERRTDAARDAYRDAVGLAACQPGYANYYVAVALEELDLIRSRQQDSRLAASLSTLRGQVVGDAATRSCNSAPVAALGDRPLISATTMQLFPQSGYAAVRFTTSRPLDPRQDVVSVEWSYHTALGWQVLPTVSGRSDPRPLSQTEYQVVAANREPEPLACLPAGTYRAEIYVGEHRAGVATATIGGLPTRFTQMPALGLSTCLPAGWRATAAGGGITREFRAAHGNAGVLFMDASTIPHLHRSLGYVLRAVLRARAGVLPRDLRPADGPQLAFLPADLMARESRWYRFPGGTLYATIGRTRDGQLLVAILYGARGAVDAELLSSVRLQV
jgi:tetratricopeptide (TPR) repeat protein